MMKTSNLSIWVCLILCAPIAHGAPAWVTDEFEITLRSGPSTSNAIQLMVGSGMQLEVLEGDAESGYSRVRTPGGTEGWVLSRYLVNEAGAREQLETLTSQLSNANTRGTSLDSQLAVVINDHDSANERIAVLESENSSLESELAEIKRTAANVLGVNEQNSQLNDNLANAEIRADTLEQENRQLSSRTTRYWFMSGALVLLVGIILGIWLPRIRWQRRSGYDRF
jgi:SH3 domain protein